VFASASEGIFVPIPQDFEKVEMTLLTVDIGPDVYMRFGHTAIRVIDHVAKTDVTYNWGMFDFNEPNFAWRFYQGILMYRMGASSYGSFIRLYRDYEKRTVWEDQINLTTAQKRTLLERIRWQGQPENIRYPYHYFHNNCSTLPRDYFDEALGGRLKPRLVSVSTGLPYRHYVRSNLRENPGIELSLDILMNSNNERIMTVSDEMFLPGKLREYLLDIPAMDDAGQELPIMFLTPRGVPVQHEQQPPRELGDWFWFALIFGFPVVSAVGIRLLQGDTRLSDRFLGVALMIWGLFAGSFGLMMAVSWMLSDHMDLKHNANLWILAPWDYAFLVPGWRLLRGGRPGWVSRWLRSLILVRVTSLVFIAIVAAVGFLKQDIGPILLFAGSLVTILMMDLWVRIAKTNAA